MPVIKCRLSKAGKLIPFGVEFEPGETIRFKSDEPVHLGTDGSKEVRTREAFALSEIGVHLETAGLHINFANRGAILYNPPPPPPGDRPIVISVEKAGAQAGAAGSTSS
jgi:hypothetical protein